MQAPPDSPHKSLRTAAARADRRAWSTHFSQNPATDYAIDVQRSLW